MLARKGFKPGKPPTHTESVARRKKRAEKRDVALPKPDSGQQVPCLLKVTGSHCKLWEVGVEGHGPHS